MFVLQYMPSLLMLFSSIDNYSFKNKQELYAQLDLKHKKEEKSPADFIQVEFQ